MKAVFDWEQPNLTNSAGLVAYRMGTDKKIKAMIYFSPNLWSGVSPFHVVLYNPFTISQGGRFESSSEAKAHVDKIIKSLGYETLPLHLKSLL